MFSFLPLPLICLTDSMWTMNLVRPVHFVVVVHRDRRHRLDVVQDGRRRHDPLMDPLEPFLYLSERTTRRSRRCRS